MEANKYRAICERGDVTLKDVIEEKKKLKKNFTNSELKGLFTDLVNVLYSYHNKNEAHKNLKPENIQRHTNYLVGKRK